ncbi:MAG: hypothetical protein JJLCMIEE_00025 [Acidimicrobiales bacterium]|nr:MAG: DUF1876 domain-containing protein [Actinomycetota bacterium]MBV6506988.1 hypothetical protein [Acidimicrobiales bacterium]RIK05800.1 MAG: DUF1876 domain-containing protein [Acidobacteriota bacterium]
MTRKHTFTVEVEIRESEDETDATATLRIAGASVASHGHAQRNPDDPEMPEIGEELAVARALLALAKELNDKVDEGIAAFEGRPIHIRL